jgi:hypothetical protein
MFAGLFGSGAPGRHAYLEARKHTFQLLVVSSSAEFQSLPWELLRDAQDPQPLALTGIGISRGLALGARTAQVAGYGPLRILMVIARPGGSRDVGYQVIARPLLDRLAPISDRVRLEVVRPPTFEAFRQRLASARSRGEPYHVVHFDGHGTFPALPRARGRVRSRFVAPQGYFFFEDDLGAAAKVATSALAQVVSQEQVPWWSSTPVVPACRAALPVRRPQSPRACLPAARTPSSP